MRITELTVARSFLTPFLQPFSVAVEERDAAIHVAVRDIKGPVWTNGNIGGLIEMRGIPCSDARFPEREDELPVVGELKDLLQGHVGKENVILPVDGDAVRHEKHVRAPRRDELTCVGVDLEHCRFGELRCFREGEPSARPMEDKYVALHVDGNSSGFA